MGITPPAYIEAPDPGRVRYGLFTAAEPRDLTQRALAGGYVYDLDHCGPAALTPSQCVPSSAKSFTEGTGTQQALPFAVYAGVQCGSAGYTDAEFAAKARRALLAGRQGAVELALWTGRDGLGGQLLGIDGFNNSSPIALTADDPSRMESVVATLEEWIHAPEDLGGAGYGYEAYIHAPAVLAAYAAEADQVVHDEGLKRTPYGSIWVFGGGYPGSTSEGTVPSGGAALYVTGTTNVWLSPDVHVPDVPQTLDRDTNQQFVLAEQEVAVSFDCGLAEAEFQFPMAS